MSTLADLFYVCWVVLAAPGVACTGVLPDYNIAASIATRAVHRGLAYPCIRRVYYTPAPTPTSRTHPATPTCL